LTKSLPKTVKTTALIILTLSSIIMTLTLLTPVHAATSISSMEPSSGKVGTTIRTIANITTSNGAYEIKFDNTILTTGNATQNAVNDTIIVPHTYGGEHNVTIRDTTTSENATGTFLVLPSYELTTSPAITAPAQRQEGDQIQILVNITGNKQETTIANITVKTPSNTTYTKMLNLTISGTGDTTATPTYPTDFLPGANTSLIGEYRITHNTTLAAAFTIGLTNSTEYHREQTVNIKALYQPSENVTLTITGKDIYHSANQTADPTTGIVNYTDWSIPSNATKGSYNVTITSTSPSPTTKNPPDTHNFTISGYDVNATARNLADEPVQNVNVTALENGTLADTQTSDTNGAAPLKLEPGNYTYTATYKNQTVSEGWINTTGPTALNIYCNLTNLKITVVADVDQTEVNISEAGINLTQAATPGTLENQTATDINGTATIHSLLPNIAYVLNVSRYDTKFNTTTIPTLLLDGNPTAWHNITIHCPNLTLQVSIIDADGQPIPNASIKLSEFMGGIQYQEDTNDEGIASFSSVFGKYRIEILDPDGIKLNETTTTLFQNQNTTIPCQLYGLAITIRVVDYLGQPIPSANVTLQRTTAQTYSATTQGNGEATFSKITGGNLRISVYILDRQQPCMEETQWIDRSTTIEIKADRYISLAGILIETGLVATAALIAAAIIAVALVEILRRRHAKKAAS